MAWECNKCGACCKLAGFIVKNLNRGDGVCKMLLDDNTCSIYETRPEICRVNKSVPDDLLEQSCNFVRDLTGTRRAL